MLDWTQHEAYRLEQDVYLNMLPPMFIWNVSSLLSCSREFKYGIVGYGNEAVIADIPILISVMCCHNLGRYLIKQIIAHFVSVLICSAD